MATCLGCSQNRSNHHNRREQTNNNNSFTVTTTTTTTTTRNNNTNIIINMMLYLRSTLLTALLLHVDARVGGGAKNKNKSNTLSFPNMPAFGRGDGGDGNGTTDPHQSAIQDWLKEHRPNFDFPMNPNFGGGDGGDGNDMENGLKQLEDALQEAIDLVAGGEVDEALGDQKDNVQGILEQTLDVVVNDEDSMLLDRLSELQVLLTQAVAALENVQDNLTTEQQQVLKGMQEMLEWVNGLDTLDEEQSDMIQELIDDMRKTFNGESDFDPATAMDKMMVRLMEEQDDVQPLTCDNTDLQPCSFNMQGDAGVWVCRSPFSPRNGERLPSFNYCAAPDETNAATDECGYCADNEPAVCECSCTVSLGNANIVPGVWVSVEYNTRGWRGTSTATVQRDVCLPQTLASTVVNEFEATMCVGATQCPTQ